MGVFTQRSISLINIKNKTCIHVQITVLDNRSIYIIMRIGTF